MIPQWQSVERGSVDGDNHSDGDTNIALFSVGAEVCFVADRLARGMTVFYLELKNFLANILCGILSAHLNNITVFCLTNGKDP